MSLFVVYTELSVEHEYEQDERRMCYAIRWRVLMYNKDSSRIEKHHYRWFALGPMRFKDF